MTQNKTLLIATDLSKNSLNIMNEGKRLAESVLPANALAFEVAQVFRGIGPADRVRNKSDPIGLFFRFHQSMQAQHELHILADCVRVIASCFDQYFFVEQAECT